MYTLIFVVNCGNSADMTEYIYLNLIYNYPITIDKLAINLHGYVA